MPERQTSILLVNGWSDDNKGDCAIVLGLSTLIRNAAPKTDVSVVSSFHLTPTEAQYHYRYTLRAGIGIYEPLLASSRLASQPQSSKVVRVREFIASLALLAVPSRRLASLLLSPRHAETLRAFKSAGAVVSKGGHIFVSNGGLSGTVGLYLYLFPLLLAIRLGRPAIILAQSIGPVKDRAGRTLLRWVLRKCTGVYLREDPSLQFVQRLGVGHHPAIGLCWDTAFAMKSEKLPHDVEAGLPENFAVLTVRQWEFPGLQRQEAKARYEAYVSSLVAVTERLWRRYNLTTVLAPQVIGPSDLENDYTAWDDFKRALPSDIPIQEVRDDLSPGQLMALYGRANFLVGTRFHSVILALAGCTPALAVSYYGTKTTGIMRLLDLDRFVLDIAEVSPEDIVEMVDCLVAQQEAVRAHLAERVPAAIGQAQALVSSLMKTIESDTDWNTSVEARGSRGSRSWQG